MAEQNQNSLGLEDIGGVENVNEFKFEPIKGYPMLNWRGKRPFTSTQYYPAQLKEVYGEEVDGWRNKIFWGDNLQVMSHLLKEFRGKVDLIYIDPPFDSKADYKRVVGIKTNSVSSDMSSFEEKQYSDIWNNDEYLQFMYERTVLLRELLSATGSIYIHLDWRKNHLIRCVMDEIFGPNSLRREIIWDRGNPSGGKASANNFIHGHDTILYYARATDGVKFNKLYEPYTDAYIKERFVHNDNDGRGRYRLQGSGENLRKQYLSESKGKAFTDVWSIADVNVMASDKTGYPTQKPNALLERIISASSDPGDLVFDCFMGSGTTQAAALKLKRRFIGADINLGSIKTTTKRLISLGEGLQQKNSSKTLIGLCGFEIYNVNNYDVFRNPVEAKELLLEALEIETLSFNSIFDGEKDGRMVKIMPVNRISSKADLGELISGFDYKTWQNRQNDKPNQPVEKILLVCMGHEPSLKAELELAAKPFKIDVEVLDILRDKSNLEFKRDSEALVVHKNGELVIERFYPMNLLQKLSLQKETVTDWREMVESIMIDWNYDGAVLQPSEVDIPEKDALVSGKYKVPADAGTIRVKITDVLSESWEGGVNG
jgi:adenine-specific DNA-methyltransferase